MTVDDHTLYFTYDAAGAPMTVTLDGTVYYYLTNIQGDVIAILDASGNRVVAYLYDAWGNPLSPTGSMASTLGALNPLRYRGYVYDEETGLYYLQSRYYNPEIGRFINADAFVTTGQGFTGNNMFAYCLNNPVCRFDIGGYVSSKKAKRLIKRNADYIKEAGEEFGVDPVIIACCIYAEQVRNVDWKDCLFDNSLRFLDTSIGLGQVKISTARKLQKLGYIKVTGLLRILPISQQLKDARTNIRHIAADLKRWQDIWSGTLDISGMCGILCTLYNLGERANSPNTSPKPNAFGCFAEENYDMLKELLG